MSNNKTVVPGIGNIYDYKEQPSQKTSCNNPQNQTPAYNGTQFPGMNANFPKQPIGSGTEPHKPIMGFLYSVSRTNVGEYWPLYMGLNTVGRSMACSVRLNEATVSDNHAEIVVRQMRNPDGIIASIQDARSTCGTLLNGSSLGFDAHECHNGDIITIGEHYELLFILIDTKTIGLEPRTDFVAAGGGIGGAPMPGQMMNPMFSQMPNVGMLYGQTPQYPNMGMERGNEQKSNSTVIIPAKK